MGGNLSFKTCVQDFNWPAEAHRPPEALLDWALAQSPPKVLPYRQKVLSINHTLQTVVLMLRIREGFHPPSSSPCKDLPAFDPANIATSHHNLLYGANREVFMPVWQHPCTVLQGILKGWIRAQR